MNTITVVTIVDRAEFSETVEQRAFASQHAAIVWATDRVAHWEESFKADDIVCRIVAQYESIEFQA